MSTPPVSIIGFTSTDFVPGYVGETVLGAGQISSSDIPKKLLVVGNKSPAGTATANQDVDQIFNEDDAIAKYGARSEIAQMCFAALNVPGIQLFAAPVTEATGTPATATITITGTATADGEAEYRVAGYSVFVAISTGDTPTVIALAIKDAFDANPKIPVTAGVAVGVVTLTADNDGIRGNQHIVYQKTGSPAASVTSALGGAGSAVNGLGRYFGGGTGTDDPTTVQSIVFASFFARYALACNDATSLADWETFADSIAGPLEGRPAHFVVASNVALGTATSLAQTTLNNGRFEFLWDLNGENHPSFIAASHAAERAVTEQSDPDAAYDSRPIRGAAPHRFPADLPQRSTKVSALQNSVTPVTTEDGVKVVVRAITTKSLNGSLPDYRTLDTSQAVVPDEIRLDLGLLWTSEYKPSNPRVADDPAEGEPDRQSGVGTPARWNAYAYNRLKEWENGTAVPSGLPQLIDVDANLPASGFDRTAKRIMSAVPVIPAPNQHQIGVSVRQIG